MSLFDNQTAPLAVRMRPQSLADLVGQRELLQPGSPLSRLLAGENTAVSIILWGPPGSGKTTIASLIAGVGVRPFFELSAINSGVKDLREVVERARNSGGGVLFIDEVHRFTKTQQDALLPAVENGWVTLVAATTENPHFAVVAPLLSRSLVLRLEGLTPEDISQLVTRALTSEHGLAGKVTLTDDGRSALLRLAGADARAALTLLEAAAGIAAHNDSVIDAEQVAQAGQRAVLRYDRDGDQHYDVTSAFIKSLRGSDVDAALHYLARMLEAGEDPRFIARRITIMASEDIGMADSLALQVAVSAQQAVNLIGMPEAALTLAHAVIYCALAPKSNAVTTAIAAARSDIRRGRGGTVPAHLRDSHYPGAEKLGHGSGYVYPHDLPAGIASSNYLPADLEGSEYYQPTNHGAEARWAAVLEHLRGALRGESVGSATVSEPTRESESGK